MTGQFVRCRGNRDSGGYTYRVTCRTSSGSDTSANDPFINLSLRSYFDGYKGQNSDLRSGSNYLYITMSEEPKAFFSTLWTVCRYTALGIIMSYTKCLRSWYQNLIIGDHRTAFCELILTREKSKTIFLKILSVPGMIHRFEISLIPYRFRPQNYNTVRLKNDT